MEGEDAVARHRLRTPGVRKHSRSTRPPSAMESEKRAGASPFVKRMAPHGVVFDSPALRRLEEHGSDRAVLRLEKLSKRDSALWVPRQCRDDRRSEIAEGFRHRLEVLRQVRVLEKLKHGFVHVLHLRTFFCRCLRGGAPACTRRLVGSTPTGGSAA